MGDAGNTGITRFGPYEVHQRLGIGGMAVVHLALERGVEGFERWVALKRLLPQYGLDEQFVASFVREAQLASRLSHPNIVRIFELGRVGEDYFISMEYIQGRDIRMLLRQARKVAGPPPLTVTCSLLSELLDALDYAHRKTDDAGRPLELVHRDVSPSNLLVNTSGHLKIIDFGIAKASSEKQLTRAGEIKGKLAYMAPEALRGEERDARSDLFSVGVIAHELLTVRPLFGARSDYLTIQRILNSEVLPPSSQNTNCPRELDDWVLRALERDPDERWQSAREMHEALGDIAHGYHLHANNRDVASWVEWAFSLPPPPPKGKRRTGSLDIPEGRARKRMPTVADAEAEVLDIFWGTAGGPDEPLELDELTLAEDPEATAPLAPGPAPVLFAVGPENEAIGYARKPGLPEEDWITEPRVDSGDISDEVFSQGELAALAEPLGGGLEGLADDTEPSQAAPVPAEDEDDAEDEYEPVILLEEPRRKRITDKIVPPPPARGEPRVSVQSAAPLPEPAPPGGPGRETAPPREWPLAPAPAGGGVTRRPPSALLPAILVGLAAAALAGSVIAYFLWSGEKTPDPAPPPAAAVDAGEPSGAPEPAPAAEAP